MTDYNPSKQVLESAWERQRTYSENAQAAQKRFLLLRRSILFLSVAATIFAILYSELEAKINSLLDNEELVNHILNYSHYILLLVPIILSILVVSAVKFDRGVNWILLRGCSEGIKREIYCYRAQVGEYADRNTRDGKLAHKIKLISHRLKGTAVHQTSFNPYEGELIAKKSPKYKSKVKPNQDDGYSDLTPENYLQWRLREQFHWYRKKSKKLDKQLEWFECLVYIWGGIGTFLVAIGLDTWVAVSAALAVTFSSLLELQRVQVTLVAYNQAADDLYDIMVWWYSLSETEQQKKFGEMVISAEKVIHSENAGWVQEMNDALVELYGKNQEGEEKQEIGRKVKGEE